MAQNIFNDIKNKRGFIKMCCILDSFLKVIDYVFSAYFPQLYELSDDPKRREFLDDLFAFMQKRGESI